MDETGEALLDREQVCVAGNRPGDEVFPGPIDNGFGLSGERVLRVGQRVGLQAHDLLGVHGDFVKGSRPWKHLGLRKVPSCR